MAVPLMAVSAVVSAVGAVRTAQAQQNTLNYQAEVARQNALGAAQQGNAAAALQGRQNEQRLGAMRAAYGASGVTSDSGSAVDVLTSSASNMTLDNLTTQYNYKLKGLGYQDQAQLDQSGASNAMAAGYMNGTSDLLRGGSSAAYMGSSPAPQGTPIPGGT